MKVNNFSSAVLMVTMVLLLPSTAVEATANPLAGQSFAGEVRAKGIYGLVGVNGNLTFESGKLVWATKDSSESGDYEINYKDGLWHFSSYYTIENEEGVQWRGKFDGEKLMDVEIIWSRQPGDWVHDLLLPKQLTLTFTPARSRPAQ